MLINEGNTPTFMFDLAYGRQPDSTEQERLVAHIKHTLGAVALRATIAAFDRQTHPTPISVRFGKDELACVQMEGFKLWLDRSDLAVSQGAMDGGAYEPHMTTFFRKHVRKGITIVDIGANVGIYTMLSASLGARVLAFEPNTENCRLILLSVAENDFAQVTLFPVALSDQPGALFFSPHIGSNGGLLPNRSETLFNPNCVVVPAMRLDDLIKEPVHLIKADVEGAEYIALKGGERTIQKYRPIITIELSMEMASRVSGIDGIEFIRWLQSFGYRSFLLGRNGQNTALGDLDVLRREWGHVGRIEDIAFVPEEMATV